MGMHDKSCISKQLIGCFMGYSTPDAALESRLLGVWQMRYPRKTINNTLVVEREILDDCVVMVLKERFSSFI
ncbi:hypothetical protein TNCV_2974771 [Trichonephila clavipes]|nr:hypothetical protein TNCV_2974771 [Trichonephila clavipes]